MSVAAFDRPSFDRTGAALFGGALTSADLADLETLSSSLAEREAGARLIDRPELDRLLAVGGAVRSVARLLLGDAARPVRALMFDKTEGANWAVAWHQDRTIAVCERIETAGFGPWSTKGGIQHVEPPFSIIERMVTLRAHLDRCDADNAPLQVALGSHRLGRIPADRIAGWAADLEVLTCLAEPGDVWAYATPILHASRRAARPRRRRVLQIDFAAEDLPGGLVWLGTSG